MAIPDYQSIMLPLLKIAADNKEHRMHDVTVELADHFDLSESERKELLPSGRESTFHNRTGWARTYLKKAGLLESTKRGCFQITNRGHKALKQNPTSIGDSFLRQYKEYVEFRDQRSVVADRVIKPGTNETVLTPEDSIETACSLLRQHVESDLLAQVKGCSPEFFERLVVRLLTAVGYGGSLTDAGKAIGKSGDGGIDGVIKEDRLGLDLLYIQAKRWDSNPVGSPEVQGFVGALHGKGARRGIFITTSTFSKPAIDYAEKVADRVVLIDGQQLASLMFEYGLGVSTVNNYVVKRVDSDFFGEDDSPS